MTGLEAAPVAFVLAAVVIAPLAAALGHAVDAWNRRADARDGAAYLSAGRNPR